MELNWTDKGIFSFDAVGNQTRQELITTSYQFYTMNSWTGMENTASKLHQPLRTMTFDTVCRL